MLINSCINAPMNVVSLIVSTVQKAHAYCDKEMQAISNVCKKGCDSCCYQNVYTHAWEEIALVEYINKQVKKKTKVVLKGNIIKNGSSSLTMLQEKHPRPCRCPCKK